MLNSPKERDEPCLSSCRLARVSLVSWTSIKSQCKRGEGGSARSTLCKK